MKNQRGFAWLPTVVGLVVILGISGGAYLMLHNTSSSPTTQQAQTSALQTQPPYNLLRVSYEGSGESSILSIRMDSQFDNASMGPVDVNGWTIESTKTGKKYTIHPIQNEQDVGGKGAPVIKKVITPIHVTFTAGDTVEIDIAAGGSPSENSVIYGMTTNYLFNTGTDFPSNPHDSLQIMDAMGNIVATYSY
jgi:hypothetical protein